MCCMSWGDAVTVRATSVAVSNNDPALERRRGKATGVNSDTHIRHRRMTCIAVGSMRRPPIGLVV